jgi:pimeloyl-ACP methyl ester carboxylesterase
MDFAKTKQYIHPLDMNGMKGRMLRMPPPTGINKEILLLYGHHSSLERMFGFAEVLNQYGGVTMPDLPGFGGMDSFYKIKEKPTIDTYADYLAAFVQLKYKRRKVIIIAMSFSVPLIIRMLQRYPELQKKVTFLVSTVGFVHRDDFVFSKKAYWGLRVLAKIGSYSLPAAFISNVILRGFVIRTSYNLVSDRHSKLKDAELSERKKRIDFETKLWKMNDVRTRMSTIRLMLTVDVCDQAIPLPMYHVAPEKDRYFDNDIVEQHMRVIFESFELIETKMPSHAPSIIATAKEASAYVPRRIRKLLSSA